MNRVELEGVVIKDLDLRFTPGGMAVLEFPLLIEGVKYDREAGKSVAVTSVFSCELFGNEAEAFADKGIGRGDRLYVLGELTRFDKKVDGEKTDVRIRVHVMTYAVTRSRKPQTERGAYSTQQQPAPGDEPPF